LKRLAAIEYLRSVVGRKLIQAFVGASASLLIMVPKSGTSVKPAVRVLPVLKATLPPLQERSAARA
jgi:hypothetical protein